MRNIELKYAKRLTLAVLTAVVFGAGAFATNVSAQSAGAFEIQVPFAFVVQGRTYAAATYRFARLSQADPDKLVLKSSTGKTLLIFHTQRLSSGEQAEFSRLTFKRFGATNFLASIRASGENYDSHLPTSKSDRRRQSAVPSSEILSITNR